MDSPEFNEIMASLQGIARRAYSLGRSEALKRVVEVMEKDESTWKPLALAAPSEAAQVAPPTGDELPIQPTHAETRPNTVANPAGGGDTPWYLRTRTPASRKTGAR